MTRRIAVLALIAVIGVWFGTAWALPGKPDFAPHIYADGMMWGTKVTTMLDGPNGQNDQSFDKLFVITNGAMDQLPVGEAAPGNPMYNGGRWWTFKAEWTDAGMEYYGSSLPVIMSYDELMNQVNMGYMETWEGTPGPPPPPYFLCPLLPVKD
jgi:hypothetical protein